ncbi:C39 family peptidase [Vibrio intestinalis]|uniref:C39 family peptidase n=1 Tax=Vibrio intestinalis TaxID=2933291 RepID=UPI0021A33206|nr:C39 family peptidase [Vibrio intestinalis]
MKSVVKTLLVMSMIFLVSCKVEKPKQIFIHSEQAANNEAYISSASRVELNIPNLNWDVFTPGVDRVGWCGEVSIQMIALYYGYYHSQKTINQLGNPKHLDLYSDEIEPVLKQLGFKYTTYINHSDKDVSDYVQWLKDNLSKQNPIFSGVKSNPSSNPSWFLDHFVVVTGYNSENIIYNSNNRNYGKLEVDEANFANSAKPYTLRNPSNFYFGFAVSDVTLNKSQQERLYPVRLFVLGETAELVDLTVRVEDLSIGERYLVSRYQIDTESGNLTLDTTESIEATQEVMLLNQLSLKKHNSYFYEVTKQK